MNQRIDNRRLSRRPFIQVILVVLGLGWLACAQPSRDTSQATQTAQAAQIDDTSATSANTEKPEAQPFKFGVVTDVHYADIETKGTRHYRDSVQKLRQAIDTFNSHGVDFVVELGDFVDAGGSKEDELKFLRAIDQVYRESHSDRHYVLGNHCLNAFTKEEFLDACGAQNKQSYYSFDHGGFHFVVLDADFKQDGSPYANGEFKWTDTWIPESEQKWLEADLAAAADKKTFVFLHQQLHDEKKVHGVKNAAEIRRILEQAGNVMVVFQGHDHSGGHVKVGGIHYCTLRALVEGPWPDNNSYAVVTAEPSGGVNLKGFGRQEDVTLD